MRVIGIETSTASGSVGLVENGEVVAEYLLNVPITHSERLLHSIDIILTGRGLTIREIVGWAISLGPGSFSGLRIGVSAVKGLAFATGKPVAGIGTLDILASQVSPTPYLICPILDARKGEVYTAFYRYEESGALKRISNYRAVRPEDLIRQIREKTILLGDGVIPYRELLQRSLCSLVTFLPSPFNVVHGALVAQKGYELLLKGGYMDLYSFVPIYVRPSEAEIKSEEKRLN